MSAPASRSTRLLSNPGQAHCSAPYFEENKMKRIKFVWRRNRRARVLVVAILVLLNLTPIQAQNIIPQREQLPCVFCSLPRAPQIEPNAGQWKNLALFTSSQFWLPPPDGLSLTVEVGNLIARANRRDDAALNSTNQVLEW